MDKSTQTEKVRKVEKIEKDFLNGDLESMRRNRCPQCDGKLLYSVSKGMFDESAPAGRRRSCGISIYCLGECQYMISHMDGFCPAWGENIEDWEQFSESL